MLGEGETLVPVTVMAMVRPVAPVVLLELLEGDELFEADVDDGDGLLVVPAGSSPVPPQAVRDTARASPAAYARAAGNVIFVTKPSLDSAF